MMMSPRHGALAATDELEITFRSRGVAEKIA